MLAAAANSNDDMGIDKTRQDRERQRHSKGILEHVLECSRLFYNVQECSRATHLKNGPGASEQRLFAGFSGVQTGGE